MTILFMGSEMDAFVPNLSTVTETTATTFDNYNASFCRAAIEVYTGTEYAEGAIASGQTDVWAHFDISSFYQGTDNQQRFVWLNASGTPSVRINQDSINTLMSVEYWTGAAWVSAGSTTAYINAARQTIDMHVVCNSASGSMELYIAGTKLIDATVDLSGTTSLKNFRLYGNTYAPLYDTDWYSQVVIADEPTIGMRLLTRYPNGAGATSGWTGAYTGIDEAVFDDADFILSASANQVSTFAQTGSSLTGYVVRAVGVSARAKRGASGPQNIQLALRSAGTDYFSSSQALGLGYEAHQNIWETDPATASDWVNTAISSLQPGVKSIA